MTTLITSLHLTAPSAGRLVSPSVRHVSGTLTGFGVLSDHSGFAVVLLNRCYLAYASLWIIVLNYGVCLT